MSGKRFVVLLIAALAVISCAYYLSTRRETAQQTEGAALFPSLAGEINSVNAVTINKESATPSVTLHKTGDRWTVAERNDYPADVTKLRKILWALRDTKIVEVKTSDPTRYSVIGVEDPGQPGATSIEITVLAGTAKHAVIIGKSVGEGSFVRRAGEKQSYSVEPAISAEPEPRFWIDSRLLDMPSAQIQRIDYKPATGASFAVHRLNATDNTFGLDGLPAGRKPLDGPALAPSPTTFTNLTAEDVSPAAGLDFSHAAQTVVTMADGNVLTLTGIVIGDKHYLQVQSTKDSALTAKTQGRAFEVASYRYDVIFKPLEQLLEPKPAPAAKGSPPQPTGPPPTPARAHPVSSPNPKQPVSSPTP